MGGPVSMQRILEALEPLGAIGASYVKSPANVEGYITLRRKGEGYVKIDWDRPPTPSMVEQANTVIDGDDGSPTDEEKLATVGGLAMALAIRLSSQWGALPQAKKNSIQQIIDRHAARGLQEMQKTIASL